MVLSLLRDLIAIPSINPSLVPGASGEREIAAYVGARLRAAGMDVEMYDVLPGRPNVVGAAESRERGPTLMFCGHLDTVGVQGMRAPFDPVERDGLLYGRGSQDMKGGVAAMIHAAESVLQRGGLRKGRLIVAAIADEEYASAGADTLVTRCTADYAVIPEPTGLEVGVAHKGFSAAEIVMHGRAAHGSRPGDGRDAILRMGRVLAALELRDRWLQAQPPDPRLGTGSLHASTIHGGGELSSYPASCCLQFERRTLPGEPLTAAEDDLRRILADLASVEPEITADIRLLLARPAYAIDPSHPWPASVLRACGHRGCPTEGRRSELLDGRGHPRGARGADGPLRTGRRRPSRSGGIRPNGRRHYVPRRARRRGRGVVRVVTTEHSCARRRKPGKGAYTAPGPAPRARWSYETDFERAAGCCS
jgi:acetylornithine deacetylase